MLFPPGAVVSLKCKVTDAQHETFKATLSTHRFWLHYEDTRGRKYDWHDIGQGSAETEFRLDADGLHYSTYDLYRGGGYFSVHVSQAGAWYGDPPSEGTCKRVKRKGSFPY
jgi:hypothetical protein